MSAWGEARTLMLLALAVTTGSAPLAWAYRTGNYSWAVAVSSDGRYVIAGSDDMYSYFFDSQSTYGKPLWSYKALGYVRHVAISKNGTCAAASDTDGGVFFFRPGVLGKPVWSFRAGSSIDALTMSEDGDYLIAGDRQGTIYLFKTNQTEPMVRQYAIFGGVMALSLSRSRALAATATHGGIYFFGEVPSRTGHIWIFQNYTSFPHVAITSDGGYIVAGGSDGYLYLLNRSGQLVDQQRVGGAVSALSMSKTQRVVAGSTNGNVSLYLLRDRFDRLSSLATQSPVTSVAVSENGERVSVVNLDGVILMLDQSLTSRVWAFNTGAMVHLLSVSSDGRILAAASDTGSVYLFDEGRRTKTNETALATAVVSIPLVALAAVALAALVFAYFVWRRKARLSKTKRTAGKLYHNHGIT